MTQPTKDQEKSLKQEARALFSGSCTFMTSVASLKTLPPESIPEIAFAGRSNVGKSSIINALVGQKGLARTSNTPGRTQMLNFFNLGDILHIVDLPGYGYAKAPKKMVDNWTKLIKLYLRGRVSLQRIYLLIDSRHGLKKNDLEIMDLLDESALSYQIVLTKIDKIKKTQLDTLLKEVEASFPDHPAAYPEVIATSSVKNQGLDQLKQAITRLAFPEKKFTVGNEG